jgi:U4/U6 small nuclear ribonucleoprotein PRP31
MSHTPGPANILGGNLDDGPSTLADAFLADLEEEEEDQKDSKQEVNTNENAMEDDSDSESDEEGDGKDTMDEDDAVQFTKFKSVDQVTKFTEKDEGLLKLLGVLKYNFSDCLKKIDKKSKGEKFSEDDRVEEILDFDLIVDCNSKSVEITQAIISICKFIRDHYRQKFSELESILMNPVEYAKVVLRIGNEMDLMKVSLKDILPNALVMMITVTATTVSGSPLSTSVLAEVNKACELLINLDEARKKIISFVEGKMSVIAPNLTNLVGSSIAAKLMTTAGGLPNLAKMSSNNVAALGSSRKALAGFSANAVKMQAGGFINEADLVIKAPQAMKVKTIRALVGKCTLCARVDAFKEDISGATGRKFRSEIDRKIDRSTEPPLPQLPKPLPAPDDRKKKTRGGRRKRKMRQRYEMTEVRKQANRVQFNVAQEEIGLSGKTLGSIGVGGVGGKVKLKAEKRDLISKKQKQKNFGSSGATSGLASSLAFTPVQGVELVNPQLIAQRIKDQQSKDKYFGVQSFTKSEK